MVTTTIYVKPYLAAYMYVRYQNSVVTELNAIRLKSIENLYHVIKNLTVKRPRDVSWRETGNLTLIIPDPRYGKEPETYNYLGHNSVIDDRHEDALMKSFQRWKKRVEEERKK